MSRILDSRSFVATTDWPRTRPLPNNARLPTSWTSLGPFVNEMTQSRSDKSHHAEALSKSHDYSPWPISCGELASLIDLGIPDDRIARYFGVKRVKVLALRAYYGLVHAEHAGPDLGRNLTADECCTDPAVASDGQC